MMWPETVEIRCWELLENEEGKCIFPHVQYNWFHNLNPYKQRLHRSDIDEYFYAEKRVL